MFKKLSKINKLNCPDKLPSTLVTHIKKPFELVCLSGCLSVPTITVELHDL